MVELATRLDSGARQRQSHFINRKPASHLYHAIRTAEAVGTPLNTFVTINFALTTCRPHAASKTFEQLRRGYFTLWLRRAAKRTHLETRPSAYVWVLENAGGCLALHWLLYIPERLAIEFEAKLPYWLQAVGIDLQSPNAIKSVPAYAPRGLGRYMLKGIDPFYAAFYGVEHRSQGVVQGKRSGFSRGIGPCVRAKIRAAAGQTPPQFYNWPKAPTLMKNGV
jgi:hypothetical protein